MAAQNIPTQKMFLIRDSFTSGNCGAIKQRSIGTSPPNISRPAVRRGQRWEIQIEISGCLKWASLARPEGGCQQASARTSLKTEPQGATTTGKRQQKTQNTK